MPHLPRHQKLRERFGTAGEESPNDWIIDRLFLQTTDDYRDRASASCQEHGPGVFFAPEIESGDQVRDEKRCACADQDESAGVDSEDLLGEAIRI